jgi:hypothetical protein
MLSYRASIKIERKLMHNLHYSRGTGIWQLEKVMVSSVDRLKEVSNVESSLETSEETTWNFLRSFSKVAKRQRLYIRSLHRRSYNFLKQPNAHH